MGIGRALVDDAKPAPRKPIGLLIDDRVKANADPQADALSLDDALSREVHFMARAGELTPEQTAALRQEAEKALARWGRFGGARRLAAVNGRGQPFDESLADALRRELTPLLKDISRPGWEKYDVERERLEARRRQAAIVAHVARMDQALSLSGEQRQKFCDLLALPSSDAWWRPDHVGPFVDWVGQGVEEALGVSLGSFVIPEVEMRALLRPAQLAAFLEPQRPPIRQVFVPQREGPPKRMLVQSGSAVEALRRSLGARLERLIDEVDAACGLAAVQREKLTMAGKLDIDRARDELPLPETVPDGALGGVQMVPISAEAAAAWPALFDSERSYYQRAFQKLLLDEQKQKLAAVQRQRHQYRLRALAETAVISFERSAALNSVQCEALSAALCEAAVEPDGQAAADWRVDCLRRMAQLPEEQTRRIFLPFQWPAARRQMERLATAARQLEEQAAGVVIGPAQVIQLDADGKVQVEIQFDELRLNAIPRN